jgi:hypothetical protein
MPHLPARRDDDLTPAEVIEAAAKGTAGALLETIGAGSVEAAALVADRIRFRRFKFQVEAAARAHEMLEAAGLAGKYIPAPTLFPLLELVAWDDNDPDEGADMKERWSALIANAASSDPAAVPPSFPRILSELSAAEAAMLDWLADQPAGYNMDTLLARAGFVESALGVEVEPADPRYPLRPYDVYIENLERLNLTQSESLGPQINASAADRIPRGAVHITALGAAFVKACRPPQPR